MLIDLLKINDRELYFGESDLRKDGYRFLKWDGNVDILQNWLSNFNFTAGKATSGTKKLINDLRFIQKNLDTINNPEWLKTVTFSDNIKNTLSWWSKADIDLIVNKLSKKPDELDVLKLSHATFSNKSILSFKSFKQKANLINKFLKKLKGFHKKALGNLHIWFVKKELSKTTAKYKSDKDIIFVRPDRIKIGEGYASPLYVVLHELGHRYERQFPQRTDFDKLVWHTTRYSKTDSLAGSESFAELFALSYWEEDYPEYRDIIAKFKKTIV